MAVTSHPTEKKTAGKQRLVENSPDARHLSALLFQNVNTLSHFRTGAPAKTLKNKLHKHLGVVRHATSRLRSMGRGRGGGGHKDSVRDNCKPVNTQFTGPGVQENISPRAPHQDPVCGRSQSLKIISQTSLRPSLIQSQDSREEPPAIRARAQAKVGLPWNWSP